MPFPVLAAAFVVARSSIRTLLMLMMLMMTLKMKGMIMKSPSACRAWAAMLLTLSVARCIVCPARCCSGTRKPERPPRRSTDGTHPPLRPAGGATKRASMHRAASFEGGTTDTGSGAPAGADRGRKARASSTTRAQSFSGEHAKPDEPGRRGASTGPPKPPGPGFTGFPGAAAPKSAWGSGPQSSPLPPLPTATMSLGMRLERGCKRMAEWDAFASIAGTDALIGFQDVPWIGVLPPSGSAAAVEDMVQLVDVGVSLIWLIVATCGCFSPDLCTFFSGRSGSHHGTQRTSALTEGAGTSFADLT